MKSLLPSWSILLGPILVLACYYKKYSTAFVPTAPSLALTRRADLAGSTKSSFTPSAFHHTNGFPSLLPRVHSRLPKQRTITTRMSADDFSEAAYTEGAWGCIAALPKVADYYEATTVEAPMLLDVLLNPSKHSAGDNAEAAKVVIDKVLTKAGINGKELRQQLENFMAKQPKISGGMNQQKTMGRSLQQVLESARSSKIVLNVS